MGTINSDQIFSKIFNIYMDNKKAMICAGLSLLFSITKVL